MVDFDGAVEGATGCRISADATNLALRTAKAEVGAEPKVTWDTLRAIMRNTVRVKLLQVEDDSFELFVVVVAGMELGEPMTLSVDGETLHRFAPGACKDVKRGVTGCRTDRSESEAVLAALSAGRLLTVDYTVRGDAAPNAIHAGLGALPAALDRCRAGQPG